MQTNINGKAKMPTTVYLLFDARMALHHPPTIALNEILAMDVEHEDFHYENPARIIYIHRKLLELENRLIRSAEPFEDNSEPNQPLQVRCDNEDFNEKRYRRFHLLPCKPADRDTIELVHSPQHYQRIMNTCILSDDDLNDMTNAYLKSHDIYFCRDTFFAATMACGGVIQCVNAVTYCGQQTESPSDTETSSEEPRRSTRAIALVRPPGHHACRDEAMGFCYFNNVAVAAKHAIHTQRANRVFILDYDIHHGNGVQDLTYDDPNIFYLSIHRGSFGPEESAFFYPGTGRPEELGEGGAIGGNLNIAWGHAGMGNAEYAAALCEMVLPLLSSFNPDLILIVCGFDAAEGDLLGDCGLTPDFYYFMTRSLLITAGKDTPFVVALEGGYNIDVSAKCMDAVALALLDEPWDEAWLDDGSDPVAVVKSVPRLLGDHIFWKKPRLWDDNPHINREQDTGKPTKHATRRTVTPPPIVDAGAEDIKRYIDAREMERQAAEDGSSSLMDFYIRRKMLLNGQLELSRYWQHENMHKHCRGPRRNCLASIKESAKGLSKKGMLSSVAGELYPPISYPPFSKPCKHDKFAGRKRHGRGCPDEG